MGDYSPAVKLRLTGFLFFSPFLLAKQMQLSFNFRVNINAIDAICSNDIVPNTREVSTPSGLYYVSSHALRCQEAWTLSSVCRPPLQVSRASGSTNRRR